MTSGVVVLFGDAQALAADVLRDALELRSEDYAAGAKVGGRVPSRRDLDHPNLPYVLVRHDGTPSIVYPIVARCTVRVSVWHSTDDDAFDLAQLCHGILLATTGDDLAGCTPLAGPTRAIDPESHVDLVSFTVRANVRGRLA